MDRKTKQNLFVTMVGISWFVALIKLPSVLAFAGRLVALMLPVIAGGILALFVSVPANGVERRLRRIWGKAKRQPSDRKIQSVSLLIVITGILLVFLLVLTLLIPEIIRSSQSVYEQVKAAIPGWFAYLNRRESDALWLEEILSDLDLEKLMQSFSNGVDVFFSNVINALSFTVNMIGTAAFAVIIGIYMLLEKERLDRHARKLAHAYLKPAWEENVLRFCTVFRQSFANFLSSQCCEAVILGILMFAAFALFRLPYGSLVGMLTAVCAVIPYIGALISCVISVFLTLLVAPSAAVRCLVVYLVVQFLENQFIYPRVVGGSVGLPPLYTLVAAMVGGKLFGIMGILFFIPLTAVVIELVKEDAACRAGRKEADKIF